MYNAARREIDNKRSDKLKRDLMRPLSSPSAALVAANLKAAEAKLAADAAAAAGNPFTRQDKTRQDKFASREKRGPQASAKR